MLSDSVHHTAPQRSATIAFAHLYHTAHHGAIALPSGPSPRPGAANLRDLVGQKLSRFEIRDILSHGRTGIVFRAVEDSSLRLVALKVLWPGQTEQQRARFVRAVRTVIDLQHPNLVNLYSAGKTGPHCWLATELIEGKNLTQVIRRVGISGMLDWTYAFRVALGVARALEAAFARRILHRNIVPHNILVRSADGCIKLGDLMLAKAFDDDADRLTRPGEIVGNLAYLSPEQTGTLDPVDQRSDIYGLGATVYALLTGRPPCAGITRAETIIKIQRERPEPPTRYHLAVPPLLEGVILRMLAKRPDERFETPTHLLRDLERVATYVGRPELLQQDQVS